jgi:VWFA-related protein
MTRRALAWTLALPLVWVAAVLGQDRPSTFRAGIDLVAVDVSVRASGQPVPALELKDFEVRDNGILQSPTDVTYESVPIDVIVALDVSQSVTGETLNQLRDAVGALRRDLAPADRLQVLAFNGRITRTIDYSDPPSAVDAVLAQARASGGTALLDTMAVALVTPAQASRRQLVMVFSDAIDSSSVTDAATVLNVARHRPATMACVLPPRPAVTSAASAEGRSLCDRLAAETGGLVVTMNRRLDLAATFKRVLGDFRSSYVLHFKPAGVEPGGFHTLDVRVSRRDAEVRSRRSYAW